MTLVAYLLLGFSFIYKSCTFDALADFIPEAIFSSALLRIVQKSLILSSLMNKEEVWHTFISLVTLVGAAVVSSFSIPTAINLALQHHQCCTA